MDEGKLEAAIEMLSGGRMLADEMGEDLAACSSSMKEAKLIS